MSPRSRSAAVEAGHGARAQLPRAGSLAGADLSASGLSFGRIGERTVFMDLTADLYFMAEPDEERQLFANSAEATNFPASTASIVEEDQRAPPALRDLVLVLQLMLRARRALLTRPIASAVASAAGKAKAAAFESSNIPALAQRFLSVRRLIPAAPKCLPDSLALVGWLGRHGLPSTLVFGVKLDPFAAHCWVQSSTLLLSDRLEEIERFTPVRIIECVPATP